MTSYNLLGLIKFYQAARLSNVSNGAVFDGSSEFNE